MRNLEAWIAGVLAGLSSPGTVAAQSRYPLPEGSDLSRLRSDVERVGNDFRKVMQQEHGRQTTASKAANAR